MTGSEPTLAVVQRVMPAAPAVVYDEWLDAEGMKDWMCPRPAYPTRVSIDARIGGELRIDVDDGGTTLSIHGRYLALDRPNRIQFTWNCTTWEPGTSDSVVTVTFEPHQDEYTLMTIHHAQLPPDLVDRHEGGWTGVADQLAARIGRRPGLPH